MSKIRKNYEQSFFGRLEKWNNGDDTAFVHEPDPGELERREKTAGRRYLASLDEIPDAASYWKMRPLYQLYRAMGGVVSLLLIGALFYAVLFLPPYGHAENPVNNEVYLRYVEKGTEETGVINTVAGMILDYRAFDTFGESNVLFAATSVMLLIMKAREGTRRPKTLFQLGLHKDIILRYITLILVPLLLILGAYIVVNGHLSPGGGFSGGAIIGGAMILFRVAFEDESEENFFSERTLQVCTLAALGFYGLAKSYSFFTGANHLESHIPLGTPGAILSGGLILPLNTAVGIVVACTMYSFYELFTRGEV